MIKAWIKMYQILSAEDNINQLLLPDYSFNLEIPKNPAYLSYFLCAAMHNEDKKKLTGDNNIYSLDEKRIMKLHELYVEVMKNHHAEIYLFGKDSKSILNIIKKKLEVISDNIDRNNMIIIKEPNEIYSYIKIISSMDCYGYYSHLGEIVLISGSKLISSYCHYNEYYILKVIESIPNVQVEEIVLTLFMESIVLDKAKDLLPYINSIFFISLAKELISYYDDGPSRYTDRVYRIAERIIQQQNVLYYKDMDIVIAMKIFGGKADEYSNEEPF